MIIIVVDPEKDYTYLEGLLVANWAQKNNNNNKKKNSLAAISTQGPLMYIAPQGEAELPACALSFLHCVSST